MADKKQELVEYRARKKARDNRLAEMESNDLIPLQTQVAEVSAELDAALNERRRLAAAFDADIAELRRKFEESLLPLHEQIISINARRQATSNAYLETRSACFRQLDLEFPDLAGDGYWSIATWRKRRGGT